MAKSTQPLIPKTALVVDDSMLIRHSVCRFFEERGFIVESATNGVEALEVLNNFVPDIIITDLSMPRMDGAELVSRVRQIEIFANTPIIVLAARRSASELIAERPSGSAAVIFKDIDIEEQLRLRSRGDPALGGLLNGALATESLSSAAKAASLAAVSGTAEAVPFQNRFMRLSGALPIPPNDFYSCHAFVAALNSLGYVREMVVVLLFC